MERVSFTELKDVHAGLRKKLVDAIKDSQVKITCPACNATMGTNSVRSWVAYETKTCSNCNKKVQFDFANIKKAISDIQKM